MHLASSPYRATIARFKIFKSQSTFIAVLCAAALIAIWLAKVFEPVLSNRAYGQIVLGLVSGIILLIIKRGPSQILRLLVLLLLPLLSFQRSTGHIDRLAIYQNLYDANISFFATVQDDAAYNVYGDYEFNITKIKFAENQEELPGRIRIRTKQNIALQRGDSILVSGKLKQTLGSRTGSISYANVELLQTSQSHLEQYRLKFFSSVYSALPEPHASLGIGFLAGVRSSIPKELQDQLARVGLTHIIAVSGYNLTILVLAITRLGRRLSKYQHLILSFALIFVFLLITGFSPSVVRAAVVCAISLLCGYFGRSILPLNLILLSAFITAYINPTYLLQDIGWWLSFFAFFGVLILAPALARLIYKKGSPGLIGSLSIEALSAQILTAPLIMHIFGTFSAISILANILVVPFIPFVMFAVFITGIVGMFSLKAALILGIISKIMLSPIVFIVEKLSSLSFASYQLKISLFAMLFLYILLAIFLILDYYKSSDQKRAKPLTSQYIGKL